MKWIKMYDDVVVPMYETKGSAGMDIRAYPKRGYRLYPGTFVAIPTGLKVKLHEDFEIQIRPRSGLAFKYGITVLNSPGTIDSDYEDEIMVLLINHGQLAYDIENGMRIAQAVVAKTCKALHYIKATKRTGGFGSTGNG